MASASAGATPNAPNTHGGLRGPTAWRQRGQPRGTENSQDVRPPEPPGRPNSSLVAPPTVRTAPASPPGAPAARCRTFSYSRGAHRPAGSPRFGPRGRRGRCPPRPLQGGPGAHSCPLSCPPALLSPLGPRQVPSTLQSRTPSLGPQPGLGRVGSGQLKLACRLRGYSDPARLHPCLVQEDLPASSPPRSPQPSAEPRPPACPSVPGDCSHLFNTVLES